MALNKNKVSKYHKDSLGIRTSGQTIYVTDNYSVFGKIIGNRPISEFNFNKLRSKIEKMNLLHLFPIVVNKKYEVCDGQHRLKVARILGLPIYFTVEDDADINTTREVNTVGQKWTTKDFLSNFIEMGKQEYIDFNNWYEKNKKILNLPQAVTIYSGGYSLSNAKFIEGEIEKADPALIDETIDFLYEVYEIRDNAATNTIFQRFLVKLIDRSSIDLDRLLDKLRKNPTSLRFLPNQENNMLTLFEELYNRGLTNYQSFRIVNEEKRSKKRVCKLPEDYRVPEPKACEAPEPKEFNLFE